MHRSHHNLFKQALKNHEVLFGAWLGLAHPYSAELLANAGYDWLLIDGEHAPNEVLSILAQLQAIAAYPCQPVLRLIEGQTALIKQALDLGAQTLLIPMIESAQQAQQMVSATRYPPQGIRGVGSALARASRWNQLPDYLHKANQEVCLLLQVETVLGLNNLSQIAAQEGVDGIFFGPSDLAASMGYLGEPNHEAVVNAIVEGIKKTKALGKTAGVLAVSPDIARIYQAAGAQFVAIAVDTSLLMQAAKSALQHAKSQSPIAGMNAIPPSHSGY